MTKAVERFLRKILLSRLFSAWGLSMVARSMALVPLVLIASKPAMAGASAVGLYIIGFAFIAASSYVWNTHAEFQSFGYAGRPKPNPLHMLLNVLAFLPFALLGGNHNPALLSAMVVAVAIQPITAQLRIALIDSANFRLGYISPAVRDVPPALASLVCLWHPNLIVLLPVALVAGCLAQAVVTAVMARRGDSKLPLESEGVREAALMAAVSAIALSAFQPVARLLASAGADETSLALYELADRPGYVAAIVIAGGLATELQRRWRNASSNVAKKEMWVAITSATVLMGTAGLALFVLASLAPPSSLIGTSAFLGVLMPALLANTAYLWSALRTRYLMSQGRAGATAIAYAFGLITMGAAWLALSSAFAPSPAVVAWSSFIGFSVSFIWLAPPRAEKAPRAGGEN